MLRHFSLALLALGSFACAETTQQTAQQSANGAQNTMRNRPRRTAARRALRAAAEHARECLPISVERAEVSGAFIGSSGQYEVGLVTGENIGRDQRACIRAAFEGARVLPFRAERYEMSEVVSRTPATNENASASEPESSGGEGPASVASAPATAVGGSIAGGTGGPAGANGGTATVVGGSIAGGQGVDRGSNGAPSTGTTGAANGSGTTASTATAATAAEPPATGTIEQSAVANVMRTRAAVMRTCYSNQLTRDPLLRARIRVRFTIDAAGLVTAASSTAVAEAGDPERVMDLARCIEGLIRGTTFPARVGASPAEVSMPFVFSPGPASTTVSTAAAQSTQGTPTPAASIPTPGTLDRERVASTIRARMPQLSQCYSRARGTDPTLAGRVLVQFVVDADGRVADVRSTPSTLSGNPNNMVEVARCVQSAFFGFTFAAPTGGAASAVLPLDFSPNP